jgi:hypothetical protein
VPTKVVPWPVERLAAFRATVEDRYREQVAECPPVAITLP